MAIEIDQIQEDKLRSNQLVVYNIYKIELNDERILYLTDNNESTNWGNDTYTRFPIARQNVSQNSSGIVSELRISVGDHESLLTKSILNNIDVALNAVVLVHQIVESLSGTLLNFRQVFKGRIKRIGGSLGIINFIILPAFSDPQKPLTQKKWSEFDGQNEVFQTIRY